MMVGMWRMLIGAASYIGSLIQGILMGGDVNVLSGSCIGGILG
jgi:hypothetical protein